MADLLDTQLDSDLEEVSNIPNLTERNTLLIKEVLAILRSIDEDMDQGFMVSTSVRVEIIYSELQTTGKMSQLAGITKKRIEEIVRQKNEYRKFMDERASATTEVFEAEGLLQEA